MLTILKDKKQCRTKPTC